MATAAGPSSLATALYPWNSFAAHVRGKADELLDPVAGYEALAKRPAARRRRSSAHVHQKPPNHEITSIRSNETALPFREAKWGAPLAQRPNLDLTIRPRRRPKKQATEPKPTKRRAKE